MGKYNIKWQKDLKHQGGHSDYPFLTINQPKKTFYINSNAVDIIINQTGFEKVKAVEVGIDFENHLLIFKPLETHTPTSINVRISGEKGKAVTFSNKKLVDRINEMIEKGRSRYNAEWDDGLLVVHLN